MNINLHTGEGVKTLLFPDNQPHVRLQPYDDRGSYAGYQDCEVRVTAPIRNSIELLELLELSEALDGVFAVKAELYIPYLMGARFDRRMQEGDSVDLKVIARLINSCGFKKVKLFDVHSDVALQLINNSVNISNEALVLEYNKPNSVLICPDSGASKKISRYLEINHNITDVIYCTKTRDLSNGNLTLKVLQPEKAEGRDCVIIDDLCDGGGTFLAIASQIPKMKAFEHTGRKSLTLIVSHGVFSKGFSALDKEFDCIITTNSYNVNNQSKKVIVKDVIN